MGVTDFVFSLYAFKKGALCVDIENFHSFILFSDSVLFSGVDRVYIFAPVTFDLQNAAKPVPNLVNTIDKVKRFNFAPLAFCQLTGNIP